MPEQSPKPEPQKPAAQPQQGQPQQPAPLPPPGSEHVPHVGQMKEHLDKPHDNPPARAAWLMHSGAFPWHQARPQDLNAMGEHLGKFKRAGLWGLATHTLNTMDPEAPHAGAVRELLRNAITSHKPMWESRSADLSSTQSSLKRTFTVEGLDQVPHLRDMLKRLPAKPGHPDTFVLPAGLDPRKLVSPEEAEQIKVKPFTPPEELPAAGPTPTAADVGLPDAVAASKLGGNQNRAILKDWQQKVLDQIPPGHIAHTATRKQFVHENEQERTKLARRLRNFGKTAQKGAPPEKYPLKKFQKAMIDNPNLTDTERSALRKKFREQNQWEARKAKGYVKNRKNEKKRRRIKTRTAEAEKIRDLTSRAMAEHENIDQPAGKVPVLEDLVALFKRRTGRDATPEEVEKIRQEFDKLNNPQPEPSAGTGAAGEKQKPPQKPYSKMTPEEFKASLEGMSDTQKAIAFQQLLVDQTREGKERKVKRGKKQVPFEDVED